MNDALYIIHAVDLAQIGDQRAQMFCVIDADRQLRRSRDAVFIDLGIDLVELGLALRDDRDDIAEQIAAVVGMHDQIDIIVLLFQVLFPLDMDESLLLPGDIRTVRTMHAHALTLGDITDDLISRHR